MTRPIKPKERETIIQSLKSGVVPRLGLQHIQVGRNEELKSFIKDIDTIADGGTSFRFVIGEYGSGKTFFMSLVRSIALEKGLVTVHADLSPSKPGSTALFRAHRQYVNPNKAGRERPCKHTGQVRDAGQGRCRGIRTDQC